MTFHNDSHSNDSNVTSEDCLKLEWTNEHSTQIISEKMDRLNYSNVTTQSLPNNFDNFNNNLTVSQNHIINASKPQLNDSKECLQQTSIINDCCDTNLGILFN